MDGRRTAINAAQLFQIGQRQPVQPSAANAWKCSCGATATGKFCPECGSPKPADEGWTCSFSAVNMGKFCAECGAKKPAGAPVYQCDKCGWKPADPAKAPASSAPSAAISLMKQISNSLFV